MHGPSLTRIHSSQLVRRYFKAGVKQDGVLFVFNDNQITDERFLIYLNDLLSSANIPDLYTQDEKDNIANMVLTKVKAAGLSQDPKSCWDYFISQVRHNLHVALCFSPVGPDFRTRARKFPALVTSTVIDQNVQVKVSYVMSMSFYMSTLHLYLLTVCQFVFDSETNKTSRLVKLHNVVHVTCQ